MIELHSIDNEVPDLDSELFVSALSQLVKNEGFSLGDLNIIFCSDSYLLEMNIEHLNHDYYTDIITFDYCEGDVVSGDLFISVERVLDNSLSLKVDFLNELARVCAHGTLHLCGYKDNSDEDIILMRTKENSYLPLFGFT